MVSALHIEGSRELIFKLRELADPKKAASVLRASVKAMGRPVLDSARSNITRGSLLHLSYKGDPLAPGYASRHIIQEVYLSKDKQAASVWIGPTKLAFYATAFLEKGIQSRGYTAQPWLVPALESNGQQAVDILAKGLRKRIVGIARKRARGLGAPGRRI